jgi:hypothetical protein
MSGTVNDDDTKYQATMAIGGLKSNGSVQDRSAPVTTTAVRTTVFIDLFRRAMERRSDGRASVDSAAFNVRSPSRTRESNSQLVDRALEINVT